MAAEILRQVLTLSYFQMTMAGTNKRLLAACKAGDVTTIRSCLSAGADVNTTSDYGNTPLHLAINSHSTAVQKRN